MASSTPALDTFLDNLPPSEETNELPDAPEMSNHSSEASDEEAGDPALPPKPSKAKAIQIPDWMPSVDSDDDLDEEGDKDLMGLRTFDRVQEEYRILYETHVKAESRDFKNKESESHFPDHYCSARKAAGKPQYFFCGAHAPDETPCQQIQVYGPADRLSRSVISDLLGRNKGAYQEVPREYKVHWSRKCYQQLKYNLRNDPRSFAEIRLKSLRIQMNRFEDFDPGCRYTVQPTKSMKDRVNGFLAYRDNHEEMTRVECGAACDRQDMAAAETRDTASKANKKATAFKPSAELLTPVVLASNIMNKYCSAKGSLKTRDEVEEAISFIEKCLKDKSAAVIPPIEFLAERKKKKDDGKKRGKKVINKDKRNRDDDSDSSDDDDNDPKPAAKKSKSGAGRKSKSTRTTAATTNPKQRTQTRTTRQTNHVEETDQATEADNFGTFVSTHNDLTETGNAEPEVEHRSTSLSIRTSAVNTTDAPQNTD